MLCKVTHCAGHISANTRPHQLRWGDREMGTTISCTECSQVADLIQKSVETPRKHCICCTSDYNIHRVWCYVFIIMLTYSQWCCLSKPLSCQWGDCAPTTQYYSELSDRLPVSALGVYSLTTKLSVCRQWNMEPTPHPSGMHDDTNNANTTINITSRYTNIEVTEYLGLATRSLEREHRNLPIYRSIPKCMWQTIKYVLCNLIFTTCNK